MEEEKNLSSGIIHCVSCISFFISSVLLIIFTCIKKGALDIIFISIFSTATFLFYLFSTLYHFINVKTFFKKFDNIMQITMLTSAFLPIFMCILKGAWGWSMFGVITLLWLISIIMISIWTNMPKVLYSIMYLTINSIFIISLPALLSNIIPSNINYISLLFFIGIIFDFLAELIDLLFTSSNKHSFIHIISHTFFSISSILIYIFYFIYVFI